MSSPAQPRMVLLRHGELHKKALSFACHVAHLQATDADLKFCKKRFFYLFDRGAGQAWVLLYFRDEPDKLTLELPLDTLVGDQVYALKGVFELKPSVAVSRSPDGLISLVTHERTLLLFSETEGDAWFDALSRGVSQSRASRAMGSSAAPQRPVSSTSTQVTSSSPTARRATVMSDMVDPFDDLNTIMQDARLREKFAAFCRFSFAGECMDFYSACEMFEESVSHSERMRMAGEIVDKYVRENASDQVNLSAEQRRLVTSAVDNVSDEAYVTLSILQAKREIFDLMRRNFFARFVAKERDEETRLRMREHFAGCFSGLFRTSGLDAYLAIVEHFALVQQDTTLVANFIGRRIDLVLSSSSALAVSASDFRIDVRLPQLKTLAGAMRSLFLLFDVDARTSQQFAEELRVYVLAPVYELQRTVDATLNTIKNQNKQHVERVLGSRKLVDQTRELESQAYKIKSGAASVVADYEAQGPKAKDAQVKKARGVLEKATKDFNVACDARQDAEIKMVSAESDAGGDMQSAMDSLQSLAMFRMETLQMLLTRAVLSEQHVLHNLDLRLSGALSECNAVDPLADLAAFAESVGKAASTLRRASVARGAPPTMGAASQHSSPPLGVPVAVPSSPSAGFLRRASSSSSQSGTHSAHVPTAQVVHTAQVSSGGGGPVAGARRTSIGRLI